MGLGQIRLVQFPIEISQEKMNLGIGGIEIRQRQSSFSFACGAREIALMVQALCQFVVRVARIGIDLNGPPIPFDTVFGAAQ